MPIVSCPSCETRYRVKDDSSKTSFDCPNCGELIRIAVGKNSRPRNTAQDHDYDELEVADEPPRRSSPRATPRPRSEFEDEDESGSSGGLLIGIILGGGFVATVEAIFFLLSYFTHEDQQVVQNNPPVVNQPAPVAVEPTPQTPANTTPAPVTTPSPTTPTTPAPAQPPPQTIPPVAPAAPSVIPAPVQPAPEPILVADVANTLRYKFEPNREYPYKFSIEANLGDAVERTEGTVIYRVSKLPPPISVESKQEGTGSAFVVSSDGYLVTCAHVIDKSKTIEVQLGNQKYAATVIASDPAHDVALIKIAAQNLTPIVIADSNHVQLAQGVRVLGFPLSDVLGNNLKITTGTIAGLNQQADSRVFQIDAAINPGNSGGPVVNEFGEVIGVASAKLTGPAVSTVGFARPANDVKSLVEKAGVKLAAGADREKLDGPLLATKIGPSIGFVRVRIGANENRTTLDYETSFSSHKRDAPGPFPSMRFAIPSVHSGRGTVTVDEFGDVVGMTGDEQLPFVMGPAALLAIVPLNSGGRGTWGSSDNTSISRTEQDPNDPFSRMRPPGLGRFFDRRPQNVTVIPAQEQVTFTLGQLNADFRIVKKAYELRTTENAEKPYLAVKGGGEWKFDTKDRKPVSALLRYELTRNIDAVTVKLPFEMRINYTDPKIIEAERQAAAERMAAAQLSQSQKAAEELEKLPPPKLAKLVQRFAPIGTSLVHAVQLRPDGKQAYVATQDGTIFIFDPAQKDSIGKFDGVGANLQTLSSSQDGKLLGAASHTSVCIWNAETRETLLKPEMPLKPNTLAFSPDNRRVYFGFFSSQIEVWDIAEKKKLKDWRDIKGGPLQAIAVSADGTQLISSNGRSVSWWNPETGIQTRTESAGEGSNYLGTRLSVAGNKVLFNKSHQSLVLASLDKPSDGTPLNYRPYPTGHGIALSENGKRVAIADQANKQVTVWDVEKGQLLESWQIDTLTAQTVALSADGKFLLTCGSNKVVQLWELP